LKNELLKLKEEKDFQSFKKLLPNIDWETYLNNNSEEIKINWNIIHQKVFVSNVWTAYLNFEYQEYIQGNRIIIRDLLKRVKSWDINSFDEMKKCLLLNFFSSLHVHESN
jgi:hypothetical protein